MKKLLLLTTLLLLSCSNDDKECKGTAKYIAPDGNYFYVPNTPRDCDSGQPLRLVSGGIFV